MFLYYLGLARRHLLESKGMTAALVLALALGVGASMAMITVIRVMTWDPLPGRSEHLFHPYIDPLPSSYEVKDSMDPRVALTWTDAKELLRRGPARAQLALASGHLLVNPQDGVESPFFVDGQYATPSLFEMFGLNILEGNTWTEEEEQERAHVVIISNSLKNRITSRNTIIGRQILLGGQSFRVIGIAADWAPRPRFHTDLQRDIFKGQDDFFIPLTTAIDLQLTVGNSMFSWSPTPSANKMEDSRTAWLQYWIYLDSPRDQADYLRFLENYTREQISSGRFERRSQPRIERLHEFLVKRKIIPDELKLQLGLSIAFLLVCLVNICALLFSRFIRRTHEVAIRRALGARRGDIVMQLCTEAFIIGTLGGLAGLLIAHAGLYLIRIQPEDYAALAVMDWPMTIATVLLACVSSLIAATLPALRAASTRIVMQIKAAE